MIFKRKIYNKFLAWKKESGGKKALLVEGARRIGKSTIVEEFAKQELMHGQTPSDGHLGNFCSLTIITILHMKLT